MTVINTRLKTSLLLNQASNEMVNKIITDTKKEPEVSWYTVNYTDPELDKEFSNLGYFIVKQKTSQSEKINKLIH